MRKENMNSDIQKTPAGGGQSELNVLYCCDENYAPLAGVSMISLLENNRDFNKITVYFMLDNVSISNKERLHNIALEYGRNCIFIDADVVINKIRSYKIPTWKQSNAPNLRFFFQDFICPGIKRLLYLDCDTLVLGSLMQLTELDMGENCIAMAKCSMMTHADKITLYKTVTEYNTGVILFDTERWVNEKWMDRIIWHIINVRARYPEPDQNLFNIVCAGHILGLAQEYNFPSIHRTFSDEAFFNVMHYVEFTRKEIVYAREHPVILHTMRIFGQLPWHLDSIHPDKAIFDEYLKLSPWVNYARPEPPSGILFRIEWKLFKLLPEQTFLRLFILVNEFGLIRRNRHLLREEKKDRQ